MGRSRPALAKYFEAVVGEGGADPKAAANWVTGEVLRLVREKAIRPGEIPIWPLQLAGLIRLIAEGTVSIATAVSFLVTAVAAVGWAYLGDRTNRKPLLMIGTLIIDLLLSVPAIGVTPNRA